MSTALELLHKAAVQFRFYETNHRDKAARLANEGLIPNQEAVDDTLRKADANKGFAEEIEEFLASADPTTSAISRPELLSLLRASHDAIITARRTIDALAPKADAYEVIAQLARLTIQREGGFAQVDVAWELKQAVDRIVAEREGERAAEQ